MINNKKRFGEWLPAFFDGEFEWDFLKYAFIGTKIMPMDFDAVIERNGHFLVCETKAAGKKIDTGQSISLTAAWKEKGFTVLHIEGKTAPEITGYACYWEWDEEKTVKIGDRQVKAGNSIDVLYIVACWFSKASNKQRLTRADFDRSIWLADYEKHEARASQ